MSADRDGEPLEGFSDYFEVEVSVPVPADRVTDVAGLSRFFAASAGSHRTTAPGVSSTLTGTVYQS